MKLRGERADFLHGAGHEAGEHLPWYALPPSQDLGHRADRLHRRRKLGTQGARHGVHREQRHEHERDERERRGDHGAVHRRQRLVDEHRERESRHPLGNGEPRIDAEAIGVRFSLTRDDQLKATLSSSSTTTTTATTVAGVTVTTAPTEPTTPTTAAPTAPASAIPQGVIGIGDSVMLGAQGALQTTIPGMVVDAVVSRQFANAIPVTSICGNCLITRSILKLIWF